MKEFFIVIGVIAASILFVCFLGWSAYQVDIVKCNQKYPNFERKQNGFYARCLIKVDGQWVPSENYYLNEQK